MKTKMLCVLMIVFFALSVSSIAEAMTAEKVVKNMIAAYEKQMKGVEDITIIMEGDATCLAFTPNRITTYQKLAVIDGKTVYKDRSETEAMGVKFIMV